MGFVAIFIGALCIGIGFLIKAYPDAIAGYNTMPKKKKKNVDVKGLSAFLGNGLIIIGSITIAGYYIFDFAGLRLPAELMLIVPVLAGPVLLVLLSQKFDHNPKKKSRYVIPVVLFGIVISMGVELFGYYKPAGIEIEDDALRITGKYGVEIKYDEIADAGLTDRIPNVRKRTNGLSFAGSNKGYFRLDEYGKCRLFLHIKNKSPFIIITDNEGLKTIFNVKDPDTAQEYYSRIKEKINDQI